MNLQNNTPIRCLIVDDEPPARDILRRYVGEMPMLELVKECGNAMEALQVLQQRKVDLLFLDIRMPQLKGTELVKILKNPPRVIFTTAHSDYALEGYELDVVDYLLKPIQFDRFVKAVSKAFQYAQPQVRGMDESGQGGVYGQGGSGWAGQGVSGGGQGSGWAGQGGQSSAVGRDAFVYFRMDRKMVKVMLHDILYVESMKDYVKVFTSEGVIITKQSISSVEAMLPEESFVRAHRSYIVSIGKIRSYTHELIEIEKMEIPIGKLFRNGVKKVLG